MKKIFGEKQRSHHGWIGFTVAALLTMYTWGGFFWIPAVLRAEIQASAQEVLERELSIGEIRFNPFTLTAHLSDLELLGRDGKPQLVATQLSADLELASLWRRGTVVNELTLAEPRLRAVIAADGTLDLSDLLAPWIKPATAGSASLPRVWIGSLAINKGTLDVIDLRGGRSAKVQLSPLDLRLEDFRTEAGHENAYRLELQMAGSEQLLWNGNFKLQPLQLTGSLSAQALTAKTLDRWLGRVLPVRVAGGSFDFTGNYRLVLQPRPSLVLDIPQIVARAVTVNERNSESIAPLFAAHAKLTGFTLQWPERELHLDTLTMSQAKLQVIREGTGAINLARWGKRGGAQASRAAHWRLGIKTIDVQQAHIAIDDELATQTARFELTPTHIVINDLSTAAGTEAKLRITTQLNREGQITLAGELGLSPWLANFQLEATELPLASLQPYAEQIAAFTIEAGRLGITGKVSGTGQGELAAWRFSGQARLTGLRAQHEGKELLAWQNLTADGVDWRAERVRIERVVAQQPSARVAWDKQGQLNLTRALRPKERSRAALERTADPLLRLALEAARTADTVRAVPARRGSWPVQIGRIDVIDGVASVLDGSVVPAFSTALTTVSGSVTGVSSDPAARAKVRLDARMDAQAPVSVVGAVSGLAPVRFADLTLRCRDLAVRKLDAYAAKFAGLRLAKGKLAMEATYRVAEGRVNANHRLVLEDFALDAATAAPKADALSLAVAVSLLKNRDGNIDLDLPVSGRLDAAALRLRAAPWEAFARVLDEATAAPFKALGSAAGGGEELAFVDFAPGSAEIPISEQAKIDRLASALEERPAVRLEIPFAVAYQDDALAVAWTQLTARVPQVMKEASILDERAKKQLIRLLEQQHMKDIGRAPPATDAVAGKIDLDTRITELKKLLLDAYAPSATQLNGLGRARAQAVENALRAKPSLQSGRVVVGGDRRPRVTAGRVRLALGLSAATDPTVNDGPPLP